MKLLFDENLSDKIVPRVIELFADSIHVKTVGLERTDDATIAHWAEENGFVVVSKDTDFCQRTIALGQPPKFIWRRVGNCSTNLITELLRSRIDVIREFIENKTESVLVLERIH